jgi:GNAT superfamily N-acetyltransferase
MSMVIRRATAGDGPALYRAWQTLRQHNSSLDRRIIPAPVSEAEFLAGLRESISRPTATALVAEEGGRMLGFLSAAIEAAQPDRLPEQHATIGYLFVEPGARRKGVARELFQAARTWARAQDGVAHIEMAVLEEDADACHFWTAMGFRPFIRRVWAPLEDDE